MSFARPALRRSAFVTGLLLLAGTMTVTTAATTASAATPSAARTVTQSAAASLASTGRVASARRNPYAPPRNYVPYSGSRFSYLKAGKANQTRIRNTVLATIQSTWGGPRDRYGHAAAQQRQDQDRDVVLRRHGHRQGAAGRAQPWRQRPGDGCQRHQQDAPRAALAQEATRLGLLRARRGRFAGAAQLRPHLPRLVPGSRWHTAREVLPLRQRRLRPRTQHRHPDLDEPDLVRLARPVEPGADLLLSPGLQRLHGRSTARCVPRRTTRRLPRLPDRADHQHLLPRPGGQPLDRPGDADAEPGAVHRCDGRGQQVRPDEDQDHPVRHLPVAGRVDRQEAARPVERRL